MPSAENRRAFAALRHPAFRTFVVTYFLAMTADNIEHVISYWMMYQKFRSPALGGFAVISHWLPYLAFAVPVGALADRIDPRRLIQFGMLLFIVASLGWSYFFVTDTLELWHCIVLLVIHGFAGVFWGTASQLLLYDLVPREELPSAVRLNATARYLGFLAGPAIGGGVMLALGPANGMLVNTLLYLPLVAWLVRAPYGVRHPGQPPARAVRGLADIVQTMRDVAGHRILVPMILLAGGASFFVGNSYQAQMPEFAHDLGEDGVGVFYSMLLAADATGALVAGIALESRGFLRTEARTALALAVIWCIALASFAFATSFPVALAFLFVAGFFELAFNSMAQALVQIHAPEALRGRVLGLFNMASLGMRAMSGIVVGVVGGAVGIHVSLAGAALAMLAFSAWLLLRYARRDAATPATAVPRRD
ncbi:MAG: MFS transporter [Burkholderiales bacterium]|nr:MFS transporter [Burkholderiales bacterium]